MTLRRQVLVLFIALAGVVPALAQAQPGAGAPAQSGSPSGASQAGAAQPSTQPSGAPQPPNDTTTPTSPTGAAQATGIPVLTLTQALAIARAQQPSLRQARAATDAARARVDQAAAPLYPQINGTGAYQLTTANYVARPGSLPANVASAIARPKPDFDLFHYWSFGLSATQLVYDFGQTVKHKDAAEVMVEAQVHSEREASLQVNDGVRSAYFNARATKALLMVAHETLENQERHLQQTEGFVRAGTRAEIDLAQARTQRATAQVGLINAENAYAAAKALLKQSMGLEQSGDFDVNDESLGEVAGENGSLDGLVQRALSLRPQFAALQSQLRSQELTESSVRGGRWPALSVSTAASEAGIKLNDLTWNWNAGANLTWRIFEGGIVGAQADEARANQAGVRAQIDALRQQVRLDVEQAQLSVRAAHASLGAAGEAVVNAREQLRLAEGRYQTGVGSGLELADAQLALTNTKAQSVQAEYQLATARSHLLRALGTE